MKTRLKRHEVGKWWGGPIDYEYDYRKYVDIARHTGVTVSAECQRSKRLYLKIARTVVKEIHPQMPPDEQELLAWSIMQTDWWEDCIRGAYNAR